MYVLQDRSNDKLFGAKLCYKILYGSYVILRF